MKAARLLDREIARQQVSHIVAVGKPALDAAVDESLRALERCLVTADGGDHNWGILLPLHQICEMADGASELLCESCVVAAAPLLRGMLEANVGLRWVLTEDTERRGLAYVVADMRRGLAYFQKNDPVTAAGSQLAKDLAASGETIAELPIEHVRAKASAIIEMLSRSPYREINDVFTKATDSPTKVKAWYEGAGGPGNIREVCRAVGRLSDYEVMYRTWSSTGHAHDMDRIVSGGDGPFHVSVSVVRSPLNLPLGYTFAITLLLDSVKRVVDYYRRDEASTWAAWWQEHVKRPLDELERLQDQSLDQQQGGNFG